MTLYNPPSPSATIGDAKTGFQSTDHNGWILLDGRLKNTLNTSQQSQATALGFGTNLPNVPVGASLIKGTLGAAVGSATITQANLPNVNLSETSVSAGTPSGSVTVITHSATSGGFDPSATTGVSNLQQTDRTPENTLVLGTSIGGGFTGNALPTHNHVVSLGGSGAAYTPLGLGVNMFVYLGA
jgi:hypothetical protein